MQIENATKSTTVKNKSLFIHSAKSSPTAGAPWTASTCTANNKSSNSGDHT